MENRKSSSHTQKALKSTAYTPKPLTSKQHRHLKHPDHASIPQTPSAPQHHNPNPPVLPSHLSTLIIHTNNTNTNTPEGNAYYASASVLQNDLHVGRSNVRSKSSKRKTSANTIERKVNQKEAEELMVNQYIKMQNNLNWYLHVKSKEYKIKKLEQEFIRRTLLHESYSP